MTRPLFTPGKDPVPFVQEVGWSRGPVWTGAGNLAPTGIRSPDRPARSQSLCRLNYLDPLLINYFIVYMCKLFARVQLTGEILTGENKNVTVANTFCSIFSTTNSKWTAPKANPGLGC